MSVRPGAAALACALALVSLASCFRDPGPGALCVGAECLTGGGTAGTTEVGGTTAAPTTTTGVADTGESTAAPVDRSVTMRIATMQFVDPHLFLTEAGMGTDTGTGGNADSCVNDVTMLVDTVVNGDLADSKFNLLFRFEDFGEVNELRLEDGSCEDPEQPGGLRICVPNEASPAVILNTELIAGPGCRELAEGAYAPINVPLINDPGPPCVRTKRSFFSFPVSDVVGSLDLRDAQVVATLDDAVAPTRLFDGVIYGFLPMAAAEAIVIDAPLFGLTDLWSLMEAPACTATYPEYLPSVDMFSIDDMLVPGVWVAINFTTEQVEYRPQG